MSEWIRSSACGDSVDCVDCVEVAETATEILVRDGKDPEGTVLRFTHGEWEAFLAGVRNGEFDGPQEG